MLCIKVSGTVLAVALLVSALRLDNQSVYQTFDPTDKRWFLSSFETAPTNVNAVDSVQFRAIGVTEGPGMPVSLPAPVLGPPAALPQQRATSISPRKRNARDDDEGPETPRAKRNNADVIVLDDADDPVPAGET